jgi:hypothetical protein
LKLTINHFTHTDIFPPAGGTRFMTAGGTAAPSVPTSASAAFGCALAHSPQTTREFRATFYSRLSQTGPPACTPPVKLPPVRDLSTCGYRSPTWRVLRTLKFVNEFKVLRQVDTLNTRFRPRTISLYHDTPLQHRC